MLFLGCLFKKTDEKNILDSSKVGLSNAANLFQWDLLNGLNKIPDINLEIINVLPVGVYPTQYEKLKLKSQKWVWKNNKKNIEIGSINLPFLKQFQRYKRIKKIIRKKIKNNEHKNIIIYSTYLPFLKAISDLNEKINVTLIVTDLPEYYDLADVGIFRKTLRKIYSYFIYKNLSRINSFVLLTEQMKTKLEVGNRPYIIVEGIADISSVKRQKESLQKFKNDEKIILYTGTLHYKFGIKTLLEGFKLIKDNNYKLWICGVGEAEEEIKKLSKKDKRIKYYGYVVKSKIEELQKKATLLINPRPNIGEYTKYSFPSKTIEYLLSGTPVLMHKLDGIPDEYDDYLFYFDGQTSNDIASKIKEICEKSEKERNVFGKRAFEFIKKNKNNYVQAKKIMKMINEN